MRKNFSINYSNKRQEVTTKHLRALLTASCLIGSIALSPTISFGKNSSPSLYQAQVQAPPKEPDAATKKKAYDAHLAAKAEKDPATQIKMLKEAIELYPFYDQYNKPLLASITASYDAANKRKAYYAYQAAKAEKDPATQIKMLKEAIKLYPFYDQYNKPLLASITASYYSTKFNSIINSGSDDISEAFVVIEQVKEDLPAQHFTYLLALCETIGKLAKKGSFASGEKATVYVKETIDLINTGKKPLEASPEKVLVEVKDEVWAKRKPDQLGRLYLTLGLFAWKVKNTPDEALNLLKESKAQDCSNVFIYDTAARIYKEKYAPLAQEFEALTDEQKQSEEGKAKLNKIFEVVDQILEQDASLLAVGEGKISDKAKEQIVSEVEQFWKSRYEGQTDGLAEFLTKAKSYCSSESVAAK